MEQITVVIGDRLGKGQKKSRQAQKKPAHVQWSSHGVAADMKLGDMMKAEKRLFRHLLLR